MSKRIKDENIEFSDEEKAKQVSEGFKSFCDQFGEDSIYKSITLDVFFEELFKTFPKIKE